jgi:hypothetical protein
VSAARNILDLDMLVRSGDAENETRSKIDAATGALLASSVDLASLDPQLGRIADDVRLAVFEYVHPDVALRSGEEALEAAYGAIDQLLQEHGKSSQ